MLIFNNKNSLIKLAGLHDQEETMQELSKLKPYYGGKAIQQELDASTRQLLEDSIRKEYADLGLSPELMDELVQNEFDLFKRYRSKPEPPPPPPPSNPGTREQYQAEGSTNFNSNYNNPKISNFNRKNPLQVLKEALRFLEPWNNNTLLYTY